MSSEQESTEESVGNANAAPKRKRGRGADPDRTKTELEDAAIRTLIEEGYSGTTARSIAGRADCNQAAIYYHFGGIDNLLIEALKRSSAERLARYKSALAGDRTLTELVAAIEELFVEDRASGHMSLLAELVGGITASPELRDGIESSTEPWLEFVEERITDAAKSIPLAKMLPARDLADLIFSVVIGVELRSKVDGHYERTERLFRIAHLAAALAESPSTS